MGKSKINRLLASSNGIMISLIILALIIIFAAMVSPRVFQISNVANILRLNSPAGIMSIGLAMVLLTGEIDISVGATMSLSMMVASKIIDYNEYLALLAVVGTGLGCGFLNGVIVAKFKVPSLVVTIGTMSIYGGLASIITRAQVKYITPVHKTFQAVGNSDIFGLPVTFVVLVLIVLMCWYLTSKTALGRNIYYTGANKRAAWMSGIRVDKVKIFAFTMCGLLAAIAGPFLATQIGRTKADIGNGYQVTAIAVCVLGGVSLMGGRGSILGVLCGMVTLGLLINIMALLGLGTYVEMAIKGMLIVAVVFIYEYINRKTGVIRED